MPSGLGRFSHVGIGKETAWGTGVAAAYFFPALSIEPAPELEDAPDEGIYGTFGQREPFRVLDRAKVSLSFDVRPQVLVHHLRSMCGPPTSTLVATGIYDHVFKWPRQTVFADACRPNPYTIETFQDFAATAERWVGCGLNSLSLTLGSGDKILRAEAEWIGKSHPSSITKSTPTFPAPKPWLFHQNVITGAATAEIDEFTLSMSDDLQAKHLQTGSVDIAELLPGNPTATLSGTSYPRSAAEYDAYLARTLRSLTFTMTGELIDATYRHTLTITMPAVRYTSYSRPTSGPGRITGDWEADVLYAPASAYAVELKVRTNILDTELA